MKHKKIFIVLLVVCLVLFSFTSCGIKEKRLEKYMSDKYNALIEEKSDVVVSSVMKQRGSYIKFDTKPSNDGEYDEIVNNLVETMNLETLKTFLLDYMEFDPILIEDMGHTRALDGVQTYEEKGYIVRWTYHPDNGLEGTIRVKTK